MLKNIDPRLNAELLYALARLGHGDKIVLVDANFPAHKVAAGTTLGKVVTLHGQSSTSAVEAILSVMPLDSFIDQPALRMAVDDAPDEMPVVQQEVQAVINAAEGRDVPLGAIERQDFYAQAADVFCVVQCSETRFWGCFMFQMGVIPPEA